MSSSLSYSRKFIILKKEFAMADIGNLKGHCKIERKGPKVILTVNVENGEIESIYNVAFITSDKLNPILTLGKVFTDEIGKGKGEYTLTERELGGNEFKATGILVMKDKDILLGGYIDKEDGSIEGYIKNLALEPEIEKVEETEVKVEEVQPHEEVYSEEVTYVDEVQPVEEVTYAEVFGPVEEATFIEEVSPVEEVQPVEEVNFVEEVNPVEEVAYVEEVAPIEEITPAEEFISTDQVSFQEEEITQEAYTPPMIDEIVEDFDDEAMEPDYKTLDYIKRLNQKNQTINYVLSILRFFPYAEPFKHNLKGYNWWLVDLDSENKYKAFLPYFAHIVGGNNKEYYDNSITTCTQLMNKYQHYLFGLFNEGEQVKYFLYGIPGTFTLDEHPYRGVNGFNTWYEGQNVPGYWIIYIDPMTGKAVDLPNPMIPIT